MMLVFLVEAVGQSRCGRFVDDTLYVQTCDLAGVLRCLLLAVGEVSGNGDDRFRHLFAQIAFGVRLQLCQDHRGDILRRIFFSVDGDGVAASHVSLDGGNGTVGVGDRLSLGGLTHESLAALGEADHGRCGSVAFRVGDNGRLAAFQYCHAAVSGS